MVWVGRSQKETLLMLELKAEVPSGKRTSEKFHNIVFHITKKEHYNARVTTAPVQEHNSQNKSKVQFYFFMYLFRLPQIL